MWKRVLILLLAVLALVHCKSTLYERFEQLKHDASDLITHAKSTDSTEHLKPLNSIVNEVHNTLKAFYTHATSDLTPYESTYQQLHQQFTDIKHKLSLRRQANKQEYIDTYNTVKHAASEAADAVHHYVDEIAPNTHVHSKKPTEPSLYDKVLKNAQKLYERAKNTVEIGGSKHVTIDSIEHSTKKLHKQLQHVETLELQQKLSIATELTKLQQQLQQFIADGKANTGNFNQCEATKQLIIECQNILKNDESKIYSQSITAKMTDTITKATETVKHAAESIKNTVTQAADSSAAKPAVASDSSVANTVSGTVSNIVEAAKQRISDVTGSVAAQPAAPASAGILDSITDKLNELRGVPEKTVESSGSILDTITHKFHELTGHKAAEPVDNSVIGYVKQYYTGLYQRLSSTVNKLTGQQTADVHKSPIDSVLSYLGINKAE